MIKSAFFDTDVVYDILLVREPFFEQANQALNLVRRNGIAAYLSALSMVNIHFFAKKVHGKEKAIVGLNQLSNLFSISSIDADILEKALSSNWKDFEDAVQYYSAISVQAELIITRNVKDYKLSEVQIATPSEALELVKSES